MNGVDLDTDNNVVKFVTVVVILLTCIGLSFALARPLGIWQANTNRIVNQHSNAYIQSRLTELTDGYKKYYEIEADQASFSNHPDIVTAKESQQLALVLSMCESWDKIPNDVRGQVVPIYLTSFLVDNCH